MAKIKRNNFENHEDFMESFKLLGKKLISKKSIRIAGVNLTIREQAWDRRKPVGDRAVVWGMIDERYLMALEDVQYGILITLHNNKYTVDITKLTMKKDENGRSLYLDKRIVEEFKYEVEV